MGAGSAEASANPLNPAGGMDLAGMKNMMDPMQLMQNMGLNKKQKKLWNKWTLSSVIRKRQTK